MKVESASNYPRQLLRGSVPGESQEAAGQCQEHHRRADGPVQDQGRWEHQGVPRLLEEVCRFSPHEKCQGVQLCAINLSGI